MTKDFEYNLRTAIGFLLILAGAVGGLCFTRWLSYEGNVIETLHMIKTSLPGWAWALLKFSLAGVFGLLFLSVFVILAVLVFSGGRRRPS